MNKILNISIWDDEDDDDDKATLWPFELMEHEFNLMQFFSSFCFYLQLTLTTSNWIYECKE